MIVIPVLTTAVECNGHFWQKQIMTIWMLVLVVGVVAMALGPILMLQPNPRQRRQAQLRSRALQLGLSVSIGALPRQGTDLEAPGMMAIYRWSRHHSRALNRSWLLLRAAYDHDQHFLQRWAWQGAGRPDAREKAVLERVVAALPESVLGLGADSGGWYVYWTESSHPGELEGLYETLKTLSETQAVARRR